MKNSAVNDMLGRLTSFKDDAKVIITIAAAVFLLDAVFVLRFQFVSVGRMSKEAAQLKAGIKSTRDDAKFISTFKNRSGDLKKEIDELAKMVITEGDMPKALENISKFADISVVRILKIRPILDPGTTDLKLSNKGSVKGQEVFSRRKISIFAKCGFNQLGRFMALLESSLIFFDIKSIEIQTDQQDYTKHTVTINLEVAIRKA
jgi:Tfp pilus assembly protein PilO